jgi:hypothetical protein
VKGGVSREVVEVFTRMKASPVLLVALLRSVTRFSAALRRYAGLEGKRTEVVKVYAAERRKRHHTAERCDEDEGEAKTLAYASGECEDRFDYLCGIMFIISLVVKPEQSEFVVLPHFRSRTHRKPV